MACTRNSFQVTSKPINLLHTPASRLVFTSQTCRSTSEALHRRWHHNQLLCQTSAKSLREENTGSKKSQRLSDTCLQLTRAITARTFTNTTFNMSDSVQDESALICRLSKPLPVGTIDSHMHIIPPDFEKFPILSTAQYKPNPHTMADAIEFYTKKSGLGISTPRMVLTQVSVYGRDNSALLSGVTQLDGQGRGVVECDPNEVTVQQLEKWWSQGIRGVRLNLVSVGRSITPEELKQSLQDYVDKLVQHDIGASDKKWVIEMYLPLKSMATLFRILPQINNGERVRWCLDHFGGLKFREDAPNFGPDDDPFLIPGFKELIQLMTNPHLPEVFLKISAQYRVDPDYPSQDSMRRLDPIGRELLERAEDRVIWASDWPHTRFEKVDSVPFVEWCYKWCDEGDQGEARREKLFKSNAERLWDLA